MGKTKDLSKDCKNIVLNLFKFFQLEKARGRPFVYSHLYFGGKNRGKCQISDECSNNERLLLDEMPKERKLLMILTVARW
jgi:hypothetical protein